MVSPRIICDIYQIIIRKMYFKGIYNRFHVDLGEPTQMSGLTQVRMSGLTQVQDLGEPTHEWTHEWTRALGPAHSKSSIIIL